jgi:hypothetical protein
LIQFSVNDRSWLPTIDASRPGETARWRWPLLLDSVANDFWLGHADDETIPGSGRCEWIVFASLIHCLPNCRARALLQF